MPLRPFQSLVSVRERETELVWETERETEVWVQSIEMEGEGGVVNTRPWVCVHRDGVGGIVVAVPCRISRSRTWSRVIVLIGCGSGKVGRELLCKYPNRGFLAMARGALW